MKYDLGSVSLSERGGEPSVGLIGDERVEALDLIYRQENCRYVPVSNRMGEGWRELTWSEIEWHAEYYGWGKPTHGAEVE